jgi:hypothetical protein
VIPVRLKDVVEPQHLRCLVRGPLESNTNVIGDSVLDVYTGTLVFDYEHTAQTLAFDEVRSFVPLGPRGPGSTMWDVQGYPRGASAVVSASVSSFGAVDNHVVAAVDSAQVQLENFNIIPNKPPADLFVIHASIAVQQGGLYRISYQVTVLVPSKEASVQGSSTPPAVLRELNNDVVQLDHDAHLFL